MWGHCCPSSWFPTASQFLCRGPWGVHSRNCWKMETQPGPGRNNSEGCFCSFRLSLLLHSLSLCSCSLAIFSWSRDWGGMGFKKAKTSLTFKIWSFCFETQSGAQHQTTRPHGHIPDITTPLYYQYSKKLIASPCFHHYLCPTCFQQGLVEKINSAQNIHVSNKI